MKVVHILLIFLITIISRINTQDVDADVEADTGATTTTTTAAAAPAPQAVVPSGPSVRLCVWENYSLFNKTIVNVFSKINTEVSLVIIKPDSDVNSIERVTASNCDIAMIDALWMHEYTNNLFPLDNEIIASVVDERIKNDGLKIYQDLIEDITITTEKEKKIYGLPYLLDFGILYYDMNRVSAPPKTWEELHEIGKSLNTGSAARYLGQFNEFRGFFYNYIEMTGNAGNEDNFTLYGSESQGAADNLAFLFRNEFPTEKAWTQDDKLLKKSFCEGEVVFMRNWASFEESIKQCVNIKYGKTYMPKSKNLRTGENKTLVRGVYLSIINNKKNPVKTDKLTKAIVDLTSRQYLESIIMQPDFTGIPPYLDIVTDNGNTEYCARVDCNFYGTAFNNLITMPMARFSKSEGITNTKFGVTVKDWYNQAKDVIKKKEENGDKLVSVMSEFFEDKYIKWTDISAIIIGGISLVGVIITVVIFAVVIKNRSALVIRRSSPLFLYFMLIGILIAFGSIFTYIGKPNDIICTVRPIALVLAFGLAFLALFIKTFRIKVIFDKSDIKVQDKYLLIYSGSILFVELIIVGLWTYLDRMQPRVTYINPGMHYYTCINTGKLGWYFQFALLIINAIILLYGCYLAIKVKDVYSDYNESKVIGLSIYGIMICMIIQLIISACTSLGHSVIFIIQTLMIDLSSFILLTFMFIPKFWKLHMTGSSQNPSSQPSSQRPSNANNQNNSYSTKSEKNGYINMQNVENEYYNNMAQAQQRNNYYNGVNGSSEALNNNNYYNNNNNYNNSYNNNYNNNNYKDDYNRAYNANANNYQNQYEQQTSNYPYNTANDTGYNYNDNYQQNYQQNNYSYQQDNYNYQDDYSNYDYNQQNYEYDQKKDGQSYDTTDQIYSSYQQTDSEKNNYNNQYNNQNNNRKQEYDYYNGQPSASSSTPLSPVGQEQTSPSPTDPGKMRFRDKYRNRDNGEGNEPKPLSRYASYRNQLM